MRQNRNQLQQTKLYEFDAVTDLTGASSNWAGPHGTIGPFKRGTYNNTYQSSSPWLTGNEFTIGGWCFIQTADKKINNGFFGHLAFSGHSAGTDWVNGNGFRGYTGGTGSAYNISSQATPYDEPFHWLVRFDINQATDADRWQYFVNGAQIALTYGGTISTHSLQRLAVGQGIGTTSAHTLSGGCWGVAGWNRRLSRTEIQYLANASSRYDLFEPSRAEGFWTPTAAAPALLSVNDMLHAHSIDSPVPTFSATLPTNELNHTHTIDAPTPFAADALNIDGLDHVHTIDSSIITFSATLPIDELTHAHSLDGVELAAASATFTESAALTETTLSGKKLRITLTGATWIN